MDLGQVDAKHRVQHRPDIEGGSIGRIVTVPSGRQPAGRSSRCGPQPSQYLLDPRVAIGQLALVGIVEVQCLGEGEYVLLTAATSSVGIAAIQIAKSLGATPICTTRSQTQPVVCEKTRQRDAVVPAVFAL